MKYSSAAQMTLDFETGDARVSSAGAAISASPGSTAAPLNLPNFGRYDAAYAVTSRIAGRINAANIPPAEHEALLRERQQLLDKKLQGTITRRESNRLQYVRWSLDRIEDAKHGQALEMLEGAVGRYEQFLADVKILTAQLQEKLPSKRRP
jgi:hypothetical protein